MQRWLRHRCRSACPPAPPPRRAAPAPDTCPACSGDAGATAGRPSRPPPPGAAPPPTPHLQRQLLQLLQVLAVLAVAAMLPGCSGGPRYSSRIVQTKYGSVRGVIVQLNSRRLEPVEVFRGVPYAAPPVGPLRLAPSQPPPPWSGTRLADSFGPVCPQRLPVPDLNNKTSALLAMPRGRLTHLKLLQPFLQRQSEDCLSLNLYVPGSGSRGADAPYPVVVFIHGESYEWNAGSPYDGSVLASWGHVIALTFNYRLGILGFLRTRLGSQDLDFGTGDILMLLRWVQDNAAAFGGDPKRVTILGHDTGAALASILLLSPLSKGLFHHMALVSGSVLSPWATVQSPWDLRGVVSHQMGCHVSAPGDQDLAPCLRRLPLEALLSVSVDPPRFLPRFGPSIPFPGLDPVRVALEKAADPFVRVPLLLGAHTTESYDDFNNQDIQYGFEASIHSRNIEE
ncbi:neuroligin-3-like [Frankliniella occidentalis]|uniref:Neuroligin-3-like n=1 Tax=Frankliniella occidentalis TaxID=133901 RepID=A0A9C6X207_FRAOC|nr:neuroligin-3-like [Frankliniella occidentalis]